MAVDAAALERFRDEIIVAVGATIGAAIRDSEHRIRAEIAEAIAASERRIRVEIADAIAASERRIGAEIAGAIAASETRLESRIEARLGARIDASAAETRRHMGVVAEDLKSKIALVAEGVITLTERLSAKMQEGFDIIDRRLLRVETRLYSTHEPG